MRPVSFAGLHRILHALAAHTDGLRPGELDALIRDKRLYLTAKGTLPKRTTLYHCRNTLLRIGAVSRDGDHLIVNHGVREVRALLTQPSPEGAELESSACDLFADLVLRNPDCRRHFFDLFMPPNTEYGAKEFRASGVSVAWLSGGRPGDTVPREDLSGNPAIMLRSPTALKSILHGVRYWARDELRLIDELFREGDGTVMYALRDPELGGAVDEVAEQIVGLVDASEEWTRLSMEQLVEECAEWTRRPVKNVFRALRLLIVRHPGGIVLIPTSRSMATITARSQQTETLRLRSYFRDSAGRYISHVRLHRSVKEATGCPTD